MAAVDTAKYWLEEIEDAKKRNDNFVKTGDKVLDIYACREDKKVPFNILYSNVDTLLPALYSSVPRPVVQRRFMDDDPLAKAACEAGKRMLEALLDTNMEGYETFTEGLQNAVIDGLLPGRGVTAVKYDAEITEEAVEGDDDTEPDTQSDGDEGEESERVEPETIS
ncbi:MAG: hypothetical protein ACXV8I_11685, partial [Methylobacter sp.]